jgi:hypothetical protein
MRVYDARGQAHACQAPRANCAERAAAPDFHDACRLRGYYVRQCGCDMLCTGQVTLEKQHYDSRGAPRPCAPEAPECTPPETSAAFQDACTDGGNKLAICGCEWLCTGPLQSRPQP